MEFKKKPAIYLQIADYICESILTRIYNPGGKIPSVREMAAALEVNPNTVMRTYSDLAQKQILYNQRGIGFFVEKNAVEKIQAARRLTFIQNDLPNLFKTMKLLGIEFKEVERRYRAYHHEHPGA